MEHEAPHPSADLAELAAEAGRVRVELRQLRERLDRLERAGAAAPVISTAEPAPAPLADSAIAAPTLPGPPAARPLAAALPAELTHVGRLLLVLAGAFLLRAATESGQLPRPLGVGLGLAYAFAWLPAALRAGRRGEDFAAAFHALACLAIAYPLIWEATMRFAVFGAAGSCLVLAATTALLLATGWRQRAPAIAWLTAAATAVTAAALAAGTRQPAPFAAILVALAGTGFVLGVRRGWWPLAWATAGLADLATAVLTLGALMPRQPLPASAALPVQLALLLLYLAGAVFVARRQRPLGWPLLLQLGAAVGLGWGGAVLTARVQGPPLALAVGLLGLAVAGASAVFALRPPPPAVVTRLVFLSVATVLALGGVALVLPFPALVWAALAVTAAIFGARLHAGELELQGAVLAIAATLGSGALGAANVALARPASPSPPWSPEAVLALLAAAGCLAAAARRQELRDGLHDTAAALLLCLLAWVGSGAVASAVAPLLNGDAGLRAAAGTALLATGAALLAHLGRGRRLAVAGWLVYPLLVVMALKLLIVDLPHGRPLTLFLSLAALGAAILAAARPGRRAAATPS